MPVDMILKVVGAAIGLIPNAVSAGASIYDLVKKIQKVTDKDPTSVTQADLDEIRAENDKLEAEISKLEGDTSEGQ